MYVWHRQPGCVAHGRSEREHRGREGKEHKAELQAGLSMVNSLFAILYVGLHGFLRFITQNLPIHALSEVHEFWSRRTHLWEKARNGYLLFSKHVKRLVGHISTLVLVHMHLMYTSLDSLLTIETIPTL